MCFKRKKEKQTKKRKSFAVGVLIEDDWGRLLLLKEKDGWGLPAGHVEPREPIEAAARREVLEETGLVVTLCHGQVGILAIKLSGETTYIGLHFPAKIIGGELRRGDGVEKFHWLTKEEAPEFLRNNVMRYDFPGAFQIYHWAGLEPPDP